MTSPDELVRNRTVVQAGGCDVTVYEVLPLQVPQVLQFLDEVQGGLAGKVAFSAMASAVFENTAFLDWILSECTSSETSSGKIGAGALMRILRAWYEVNADFFGETRLWVQTLVGDLLLENAPRSKPQETA